MAFANVGTEPAFVTCNFDTLNDEVVQADSVHGFAFMNVAFQSDRDHAAEASCTLVSGILGVPRFVSTQSVVLPGAGSGEARLVTWTAVDDYAGRRFQHPALSCLLPPGIRIAYLRFAYSEDIGF